MSTYPIYLSTDCIKSQERVLRKVTPEESERSSEVLASMSTVSPALKAGKKGIECQSESKLLLPNSKLEQGLLPQWSDPLIAPRMREVCTIYKVTPDESKRSSEVLAMGATTSKALKDV